MKTRTLMVAESLEDLERCTAGTRIATNQNKLLLSELYRGTMQWFEQGELTMYRPAPEWFPAFILPERRD